MFQLLGSDDRLDARQPPGDSGHGRRVRTLPGVLVRPAQRLAAFSRGHARADEVYRRTLLLHQAGALAVASVSALRSRANSGAQHGPKRPLHLLAVSERARPLHHIFRVPQGKEFHPPTLAGGDSALAPERPNRELLELWRVHRTAKQFGLPLLPFAHCDPGPEATAGDAGTTEG